MILVDIPGRSNPTEVSHVLKTWPDQFQEIENDHKVHEFRRNDRFFTTGDLILLREFRPAGEHYTGRWRVVRIMAISRGPEWGIPEGFAVFSIRRMTVVRVTGIDLEATSDA